MVYNYKVIVVQKMPPIMSIRKSGKINRTPLMMGPYLPQSISASMPAVMSRTYKKKTKRKTKRKSSKSKKKSSKKKTGGSYSSVNLKPAPYKRFIPLTMKRKEELAKKKQSGGYDQILRPGRNMRYLSVSKKRVAEINTRRVVKKASLKKKVAKHIKNIPADQRKTGGYSRLRPAPYSRYEPITQRAKELKKKRRSKKKKGGSSHHLGLRY